MVPNGTYTRWSLGHERLGRGRAQLLTKCTAITAGGGRCQGVAIDDSSGLCHAHHPDRAERRKRAASKGGRRGGRGRTHPDLTSLKQDVRHVIDSVLDGTVGHSPGGVALQGFNVLLRAAKLELDIREQQDLIARLEELETALQEQHGGGRYGTSG